MTFTGLDRLIEERWLTHKHGEGIGGGVATAQSIPVRSDIPVSISGVVFMCYYNTPLATQHLLRTYTVLTCRITWGTIVSLQHSKICWHNSNSGGSLRIRWLMCLAILSIRGVMWYAITTVIPICTFFFFQVSKVGYISATDIARQSVLYGLYSAKPEGCSPNGEGCIRHTARDCHAMCITYPKGGTHEYCIATDIMSSQYAH